MRRCFLVCYDICSPRRWRKVFKLLKGYGEHWQYSIFFCVLKDIDRVRLESSLKDAINQKDDQVLMVDLGANEDAARQAAVVLGQSMPEPNSGMVVV